MERAGIPELSDTHRERREQGLTKRVVQRGPGFKIDDHGDEIVDLVMTKLFEWDRNGFFDLGRRPSSE